MNEQKDIVKNMSEMLMTIFTKSGSVQLRGPVDELRSFKEQVKHKDNRHTFIEVPLRFLTYNPALEGVTILPAQVGVIVFADPVKAALVQKTKILQPVGIQPKKLN